MAFWHDLRYGTRMLRRSPGFAATAVVCLALGIGATTAIFSVVSAILLRPLPYQQPEGLARIYTEFPGFPGGGLKKFVMSRPELLDLRRDLRSWESIDAWITTGVNVAGSNDPIRVTASFVSGGLMPALGVAPLKGRLLTPDDDQPGKPLTAVISHGLWQRAFGGDPNILGRDSWQNGLTCTIVGVMPADFRFPPGEADPPEMWSPLQINPAQPGGRGNHGLSVVGRLKSGVTLEQARQEMAAMVEQSGRRATERMHLFHPKNHTLVAFRFQDEVVGAVRPALLTMLAAVGFVLLIAALNVANLLLARSEARQREIAIRKAMGAGAMTLAGQFLTEGLLLAAAGAVLGVALAQAGLRYLLRLGGAAIPRSAEVSIDWRVLVFALLVLAGSGVLFGLAPLFHVLRDAVGDDLKAAGARASATAATHRLRQSLAVAELAVALVLLIGSGLMVRAFWKLQAVDAGVRATNVLTLRLALPTALYPKDEAVLQFRDRLQGRLSSLPGVVSATLMSGLPPVRPLNANDTDIEGFVPRPGGPIQNVDYYQIVGGRYFETLGVPLREGRLFDDRDGAGAPETVIVNQTMAQTFWPGQSPLGRRIRPGSSDPWRTIVGVVGDVKNGGLEKPAGSELYLPAAQASGYGARVAWVALRTTAKPAAILPAVRREIAALDPALPVAQVRTLEDVLAAAQSRPRFLTALLAIFSSVALALAAIGLYGVLSYLVAQRTPEIGIRLAIGASPFDVLRMVLAEGLRVGLLGVAAGGLGAVALTRFLKGLLFGVDSLDPLTFATMAGLLVAVILLACYAPARRATQVDPLIALRYE